MIIGVVTSDEGRICLTVKGGQGRKQELSVVIDTGYTGSLTLPSTVIVALRLPWRSLERGTLADGSECLFDVYEATVMWDGNERSLLVNEAEGDPLLGMLLLKGHELKMQVREQGKVVIKPLAAR